MRRLPLLALAAMLAAAPAVAADKKAPPKKEPEAAKPAGEIPAQSQKGVWGGGPVVTKDGGFSFCKVESRFEQGHLLLIARNQPGEINIGLGIPGATLPPSQKWKITLTIDGKTKREREAVAPQGDLLVIPQGKDDDFYTALMAGSVLRIQSDTDNVAFELKGTKKLLGDLKTCADTSGKENSLPPPLPPPPLPYPQALTAILSAAGFRDLVPVSFDDIPPGQRPADYAWRFGSVMGGVEEREVISDSSLEELSQGYATALKDKCAGQGSVTIGQEETLEGLSLRTGSVECVTADRKIHVAMLFYLTKSKLFTVFFHEGGEAERAVVDTARDNLTNVIRTLAKTPPKADKPKADAKPEAKPETKPEPKKN
ncbi:hypothetical protein M2352_001778 [Azospirillum fermentarium]|uniref:hypothetical protein n=1 Tax=Azospirillum fermentarium TaxID=1233114 RepID=UPI002225DAF0|nr:hypothetical protein [Azospirillum fermentarium]MCW2246187.1 hypothetical protein [Azospirillum fermentarium]